ncbi:MAG TPA: hypothetical protein VHM65_00015, partial [Candidatus Lustribacter sp.]|nr:hypothetical protein [Candidatus Lustribacter sp.]
MTPGRPRSRRRPCRVLVVAAAGYGKTASAEADLADDGLRCSAAQVLALGTPVSRPLVVEDLHQVCAGERVEVLQRLAALADSVPVTITSREPLDRTSRGMLRGQVFERGPGDLALTGPAIARVLADEYGIADPEAPARIHALTRGWPALVHFAADALSRRPGDDLAAALTRPASAAAAWLQNDVLSTLPGDVAGLLSALADLDPLTEDLVGRRLGGHGPRPEGSAFAWLCRVGLLVPHPRLDLLGREGFSVVPAVAMVLTRARAGAATDPARLVSAARWYEHHGHPFAAADAYARAGDGARAMSLVDARGAEMIAHGDAPGIVTLIGRAEAGSVTLASSRINAEALHMSGDSTAAQRAYAPLAAAADLDGWDPGLAHRLAAVHHTQGTLRAALDVLDRVPPGTLTTDSDGIHWRACRVNVLSMLGHDEQARDLAASTLALAEHATDPRSLTAAHQAMAKTSSGARKQAHLGLALAAAKQAGDVVSAARILGNQSFVLLAAASYTEAVGVSREAVRAAEIARPTGALIAALHN